MGNAIQHLGMAELFWKTFICNDSLLKPKQCIISLRFQNFPSLFRKWVPVSWRKLHSMLMKRVVSGNEGLHLLSSLLPRHCFLFSRIYSMRIKLATRRLHDLPAWYFFVVSLFLTGELLIQDIFFPGVYMLKQIPALSGLDIRTLVSIDSWIVLCVVMLIIFSPTHESFCWS